MSIPKKGSRKIIVDKEPFIWRISKATRSQVDYPDGCLEVAVEHTGEPRSSSLMIITDRLHPEGFSFAHGKFIPVQSGEKSAEIKAVAVWKIERDYEIIPITPSDVALWIKQAIQLGWLPKQAGKTFGIRVDGECVRKIYRY
jgi:hypothetical protein